MLNANDNGICITITEVGVVCVFVELLILIHEKNTINIKIKRLSVYGSRQKMIK